MNTDRDGTQATCELLRRLIFFDYDELKERCKLFKTKRFHLINTFTGQIVC